MINPIDKLIDCISNKMIARGTDEETALIKASALVFTALTIPVAIVGGLLISWVIG